MLASLRIDFPDIRAACFCRDAVLADIAVGADGHIELRTVGVGDDVLGPVMVDRAGRKIDDLLAFLRDARLAVTIGEAQHGIGVGDIERIAGQGHAERRVQAGDEDVALIGDAVAIGVAQQHDAIRRWSRIRTRRLHDRRLDVADDTARVVRFRRRVGFRHQHVAIGQHQQPAWMIEVFCECRDRKPVRRCRLLARLPVHGFRDVHCRNECLVRRGKRGMRSDTRRKRKLRLLAAGRERDRGGK